jgi:hypothetical protein
LRLRIKIFLKEFFLKHSAESGFGIGSRFSSEATVQALLVSLELSLWWALLSSYLQHY